MTMPKRKKVPQLKTLRHPMQPVGFDEENIIRFKRNAIVRALLDEGPFTMNQIVIRLQQKHFSKEDYTQFIQLIGYSVDGAGDLDNFDRKVLRVADKESEKIWRAAMAAGEEDVTLPSIASRFLAAPNRWCPRCGVAEAFHPEACDITPEEWSAVTAGVDAARRTRTTWRCVAVVRGFSR